MFRDRTSIENVDTQQRKNKGELLIYSKEVYLGANIRESNHFKFLDKQKKMILKLEEFSKKLHFSFREDPQVIVQLYKILYIYIIPLTGF